MEPPTKKIGSELDVTVVSPWNLRKLKGKMTGKIQTDTTVWLAPRLPRSFTSHRGWYVLFWLLSRLHEKTSKLAKEQCTPLKQ